MYVIVLPPPCRLRAVTAGCVRDVTCHHVNRSVHGMFRLLQCQSQTHAIRRSGLSSCWYDLINFICYLPKISITVAIVVYIVFVIIVNCHLHPHPYPHPPPLPPPPPPPYPPHCHHHRHQYYPFFIIIFTLM